MKLDHRESFEFINKRYKPAVSIIVYNHFFSDQFRGVALFTIILIHKNKKQSICYRKSFVRWNFVFHY
jgi:hypothetical protein